MIEEVVNSILEAEDVAAKKIAQAKQEANDIVSFAEAEADKLKKQKSAENKAVFAEKSKEIHLQASRNANDELTRLNAIADEETAKYEKNVDKAMKIVLEHLL